LKFNYKEKYEIEILENNIIYDNEEVKKIMDFYLHLLKFKMPILNFNFIIKIMFYNFYIS